jgi:hypothetical protein
MASIRASDYSARRAIMAGQDSLLMPLWLRNPTQIMQITQAVAEACLSAVNPLKLLVHDLHRLLKRPLPPNGPK